MIFKSLSQGIKKLFPNKTDVMFCGKADHRSKSHEVILHLVCQHTQLSKGYINSSASQALASSTQEWHSKHSQKKRGNIHFRAHNNLEIIKQKWKFQWLTCKKKLKLYLDKVHIKQKQYNEYQQKRWIRNISCSDFSMS